MSNVAPEVNVLKPKLLAGLEELALSLPVAAPGKFLDYLDLLQRWNRTYNLTAVRDPAEMLTQHIFDSLSVLPLLEKSVAVGRHLAVADIGSGAGLPGIPLAIAHPDWALTLVEAVEKKTAFQRQAVIELGLANVMVQGGRVEKMLPGGFDLVISRAFASLPDFVRLAGHLVAEGGWLCAMKGVVPETEMVDVPADWIVDGLEPLVVPGLAAQRHMLLLRKA